MALWGLCMFLDLYTFAGQEISCKEFHAEDLNRFSVGNFHSLCFPAEVPGFFDDLAYGHLSRVIYRKNEPYLGGLQKLAHALTNYINTQTPITLNLSSMSLGWTTSASGSSSPLL